MILPTIHLNGTAASELLESHIRVLDALRAAVEDMSGIYPNGRDYYVQGDRAIGDAMAEHSARVRAIETVIAELETITEHIADHTS